MPDVTRQDVETIWVAVLNGTMSFAVGHARAEAMLDRVSSESPVVNWGLTSLHSATGDPGTDGESLTPVFERWQEQLRDFDADPAAWMVRYCDEMVQNHRKRLGDDAARHFASRLAADVERGTPSSA